jgi:peptidyl-prolyl cis-trans isomerase SurA
VNTTRAFRSAILGLALLLCAEPAFPRVIDGVVALVNDEPVTFSEVREEVAGGLGIPVGDADVFLREEKDTGTILRWINGLVESVLVRTELAKKGHAIPEAEIDRSIESVRKANNLDERQFLELLTKEGLTLASYRRRIRWQMERGAIVRARKFKDVAVTEDETREYFRANTERFLVGSEVRLETMYFPLPEGPSAEEVMARVRFAAQQAADAVRAGRPLADGLDVARLVYPAAQVLSGDFVPTEDLLPEMQREIGRLRSGEHSSPFFAGTGVYIVRVVERRGGKPREFASVKESLTEELLDRRSEKAFADIIEELKKSASIDVRL